ncbi:MAG: SDR family oxidoreductase [Candidatus Cloacimonetes bacterium]|nr:SDR family oxidoreductase [Candidatus Cloacimonadota bacterium]
MKSNQAIVITGANGNLASYFNRQALEKGYNLILFYNHQNTRLQALQSEFSQKIRLIKTDFAESKDLKPELDSIIRSTGWQIDALFHCSTARSSDFQSLSDSTPETWERIIDVNVKGTFRILQAVLPYFRQQRHGKIVLLGSNVTRIGLPRGSAYSASKAAIANISRSLAAEEAKYNIFINTISPGPIKIDDSHFSESYRKFREEYYREKMSEIPLKRCASFEDVCGLAWFLISENNQYITGEEFYITGGKL